MLLSDIDGLYDSDPRKGNARFISEVDGPADLDGVVAGRGSHLGTGGMASKLSSALLAADAGVPVLLAAASDAATALADASVGTVFAPRPERMSARRFWVRYAAESAGALTLDDGAVRAVVRQRRSLLPAGITAVSGRFYGGDVVELRAQDATMVARGVVAYDARRTGRRCSAGRRRICPPRCAAPPCTPTTWSPSKRFRRDFCAERTVFTPKSLSVLSLAIIDLICSARCVGVVDRRRRRPGSTSTPCAARSPRNTANRRVGQHHRGEHARRQLRAPQHAAVVHLGGDPDLERAVFELLLGRARAAVSAPPRDRLDHLARGTGNHGSGSLSTCLSTPPENR